MKSRRFLLVAVVLVFAAGCSRVQFAYNQLDWLIPHKLESYMTFTGKQRAMLDGKVDALLTWHCGTQLVLYAQMLRSANADFQAGTMTHERLGEYTTQLEARWRAIMAEAGPAIADVLLTASDQQIEGIFIVFAEKNAEWLEEYNSQTDQERREQYQERMTEELERWFGPLGAEQRRAVSEWSRRITPLGLEGLKARQQWQAGLRDLVADRADETAFRDGVRELFVNPRALRSPVMQQRFDDNKALALDLVFQIGKHMDGEQRKHLALETASVARDFDELVCDPRKAGSGTEGGRTSGSVREGNGRSDP